VRFKERRPKYFYSNLYAKKSYLQTVSLLSLKLLYGSQ
jgi:hypothetical protein